jgi:hypothetical protein
MLTSGSIISHDPTPTGPTSLAEFLFPGSKLNDRVVPSGGFKVRCDYCAQTAFQIIGDAITVTHRHGSQYHRTVVSLEELGLMRING